MDAEIRYRGRNLGPSDIAFVRQLIADHPRDSRRRLSARLCDAWNWVQSNGQPCDMVARGLLLSLHRAELVELPAVRYTPPNNVARHAKPVPVPQLTWEAPGAALSELRPLAFQQVRRSTQERLFDSLLQTHHYLGYTRPVGEHLKYLVTSHDIPVACLAFSSAPRHLGARDRFIGWSAAARRAQVHLLAYNTRFLILPWARVPHLASHILSEVARRISSDWNTLYGHPVWFLETFVEPERFRGTCYRAANWLLLGETTGRGKAAPTKKQNRSIKQVWGYPLARDFRRRLCVSGPGGA